MADRLFEGKGKGMTVIIKDISTIEVKTNGVIVAKHNGGRRKGGCKGMGGKK